MVKLHRTRKTQLRAADSVNTVRGTNHSRYYIIRPDNTRVPLIAVDELPDTVRFDGIKSVLTSEEIVARRMICVNDMALPKETRFQVNASGVPQITKATRLSTYKADAGKQQSVDKSAEQKKSEEHSKKFEHSGKDAETATKRQQPIVSSAIASSSIGKKVYCSYWLRTGSCDYIQEGCKYLHVIPEEEIRMQIGVRELPRWVKEARATANTKLCSKLESLDLSVPTKQTSRNDSKDTDRQPTKSHRFYRDPNSRSMSGLPTHQNAGTRGRSVRNSRARHQYRRCSQEAPRTRRVSTAGKNHGLSTKYDMSKLTQRPQEISAHGPSSAVARKASCESSSGMSGCGSGPDSIMAQTDTISNPSTTNSMDQDEQYSRSVLPVVELATNTAIAAPPVTLIRPQAPEKAKDFKSRRVEALDQDGQLRHATSNSTSQVSLDWSTTFSRHTTNGVTSGLDDSTKPGRTTGSDSETLIDCSVDGVTDHYQIRDSSSVTQSDLLELLPRPPEHGQVSRAMCPSLPLPPVVLHRRMFRQPGESEYVAVSTATGKVLVEENVESEHIRPSRGRKKEDRRDSTES